MRDRGALPLSMNKACCPRLTIVKMHGLSNSLDAAELKQRSFEKGVSASAVLTTATEAA